MSDFIRENDNWRAEYEGGFLFIENKETGAETVTRLENTRGQCITRGQFDSSIKSHGLDRAAQTFAKLGVSI